MAAKAAGQTGDAAYLGGAQSLNAGWGFACVTDANDDPGCWGSRELGTLGDGRYDGVDLATPSQPLGLAGVTSKISGSNDTACALLTDASIDCWGRNYYGQVGNGTREDGGVANPASVIGSAGSTDVASGHQGSCLLDSSATEECWGGGSSQSYTPTVVNGDFNPAASLTTAGRCIITTAGGVQCLDGSAEEDIDISNVVSAAEGDGHGCALITNGTVSCWGADYNGQLGDGTDGDYTTVAQSVPGITDAVAVGAGSDASCAALADGTVDCWGQEIGTDGVNGPSKITSPTPVPGISGAVAVAVGDATFGYSGTFACAVLNTGRVRCWGESNLGTDGSVASSPYDLPAALEYAATAPTAPAPPVVSTHPSPTRATLDWSAPASTGGRPVTDYRLQYQRTGDADWSLAQDMQSAALSGTVTGLTRDDSYLVRVSAYNGQGWSDWSSPSDPTLAAAGPAAPDLSLVSQSGHSATVSWTVPDDNGQPITGYSVDISRNGGDSWTSVATPDAGTTTATVSGLDDAAADLIRVEGINAQGVGTPSDFIVVTTPGTGPQRLTIETASGQPVTDGLVSWAADDGDSQSATSYVPNSDGTLTFPRVVPGMATVSIAGGLLPDGVTTSGSWDVPIGTDPQVLKLPEEPALVSRQVNVTMQNGVPVVSAALNTLTGLVPAIHSEGFRFAAPATEGTAAVTDGSGTATVNGYQVYVAWQHQDKPITAQVVYDDGVLVQKRTVTLSDPVTPVQLEYMPWLTDSASTSSPVDGALVRVSFAVRSNHSKGSAAVASRRRARGSGVKVSIKPPAGASASSCRKHQKLTGVTSSRGKVTLRVCASRSGDYRVVARGAVPTRPISLRVKNAPPLAPSGLRLRSPRAGQLTASWRAPKYAGGHRVTGYRVVVSSHGHKSRHLLVHARSVTVKSLARFASWSVKVRAVTSRGVGDPVAARLRVA